MSRLLAAALWVHPLLGLVTVALAVRAASLALRGRGRTAAAGALRARHRRLAPRVWALVVLNWLLGLGSIRLDPRDMELAASGHFQIGTLLVVLFTASALVSRRIDEPWARRLHPWIGATALIVAFVQVFLGLQLMPV